MRYPLVLIVAVALFQAGLISGEEVEYGKQKRKSDGVLEAFSTLQKTLTDKLSDISSGTGKEVRDKRESRFWANKEEPLMPEEHMDELIGIKMGDKPTLKSIRETTKELLSVIQKLHADDTHDECKQSMVETMKKIISLVLQLIHQLVNYIMNHVNV